jgi:hypothetical protein
MTESARITSCGFIDPTGWGDHLVQNAWPVGGTVCPDRLAWPLFSECPFDRFGRLDMVSQYAVVVAEMSLRSRTDTSMGDETAIVLTTTVGSLAADLEFLAGMDAPGGASPTVFSYTLPSTAMAEVAIRFHIRGPCLCFLMPPDLLGVGLREGLRLVCRHEARRCLCIVADAMPACSLGMLPAEYRGGLARNSAYAFLIEGESSSETAVSTGLADMRVEARQQGSRADTSAHRAGGVASGLFRFLVAADPHDQVGIESPDVSSAREVLVVTKAAGTIS